MLHTLSFHSPVMGCATPSLFTPPSSPGSLTTIYQRQNLSGCRPQHCLPKPAVLAWSDWRWGSALRWRLFCPRTDGDWIRGNERKKEPAQNHGHKSQQGLESTAWGRKQPSSPHLRTQLSLLQGRKNHTRERGPCFLLFKPSTIILKDHYYSKESTLPFKLPWVLLLLGN